jgi:hypothetical protein
MNTASGEIFKARYNTGIYLEGARKLSETEENHDG